MTDSLHTAIDRLGWLTFWGRHLMTPPTEVVPLINQLLRDLAQVWDGPTAFLGPVLDALPQEQSGRNFDFRASVLIPDGVGALVWTAKEREAAKRLKTGELDLLTAEFVAFPRLPSDVQKELLPHVPPLLERLHRQLAVRKESQWRNS
jgi:hypothetical protein